MVRLHLHGLQAHKLIFLGPRILVRPSIIVIDQDVLALKDVRHQISRPQNVFLVREGQRVVVFGAPDADVGLATVRHSSILLNLASRHHAWYQEMSRTNSKVMVRKPYLQHFDKISSIATRMNFFPKCKLLP